MCLAVPAFIDVTCGLPGLLRSVVRPSRTGDWAVFVPEANDLGISLGDQDDCQTPARDFRTRCCVTIGKRPGRCRKTASLVVCFQIVQQLSVISSLPDRASEDGAKAPLSGHDRLMPIMATKCRTMPSRSGNSGSQAFKDVLGFKGQVLQLYLAHTYSIRDGAHICHISPRLLQVNVNFVFVICIIVLMSVCSMSFRHTWHRRPMKPLENA